jgi:hypothetical protein
MGTEVALDVIFSAIAAPRWLWLFRIEAVLATKQVSHTGLF